MIALYAAAMTLLVACTFGLPGYALWGVFWAIAVYRHMSTNPNQEKVASES